MHDCDDQSYLHSFVLIGTQKPKNAKMTVLANELPTFVLLRTSKLTGLSQAGDCFLTNCVRLFQYFYLLLKKSLLKLDKRKFSDCMLLDVTSHEKYFDFYKSLAYMYFGVLISDQDFGQVLLKSDKSTYPVNSLEQR